jgi:hypothetical protein
MVNRRLNEADFTSLQIAGQQREILLGILRELMAIEDTLEEIKRNAGKREKID